MFVYFLAHITRAIQTDGRLDRLYKQVECQTDGGMIYNHAHRHTGVGTAQR